MMIEVEGSSAVLCPGVYNVREMRLPVRHHAVFQKRSALELAGIPATTPINDGLRPGSISLPPAAFDYTVYYSNRKETRMRSITTSLFMLLFNYHSGCFLCRRDDSRFS